jgi:formylglycine-generating enzyme required for sulfatase activity
VNTAWYAVLGWVTACGALGAGSMPQPTPAATQPAPAVEMKAFSQPIPTAASAIEMLPIPANADGSIKPFYMSRTEITWEIFDVFAYRLDEPEGGSGSGSWGDASTRPSKPYLPPDRGFGHEGYAAICVSFKNATEFCAWLSRKSGRTYRLATEAEWEHACAAGGKSQPGEASIKDSAWFADNAEGTPHRVASKAANAWGLCDMLGNVQEWVTGRDAKPVTKGGSYRDGLEHLTCTARQPYQPAWNASDPQMPKSVWWLADAPFVGFRIVCEAPGKPEAEPTAPKANP